MNIINKILYQAVKKHLWQLLFILLLIFTTVGIEILIPWSYKILIDNVLGKDVIEERGLLGQLLASFNSPQALGFFVVLLYFVSNTLVSFVDYFRYMRTKKVIKQVIYEFSKSAFRNLESYNIGFFRTQDIGDYIYRLSYDVTAIGDVLQDGILPIVSSSLYIIVTTIIMFFISVKLTLISFLTIPFLAATLYFFNKRIGKVTKHSETLNSTVFSFVQQALTQLKVIQAYSQEEQMASQFDKTVQNSLQAELQMHKANYLLDLLIGIAIAVTYATIFGYGINAVFSGEITTGLLIVFIFYMDNLTNPLITIADAITDFREYYVQVTRMSDFFKQSSHEKDTGQRISIEDTNIVFENVTVLGEGDFRVLDNISCKIPQGGVTIIAGVSGSGKTSLISLIPRLIEQPTKGKILLGSYNITDYSLKTLRENIALVPQESLLLNDTIYNLIAFGKPNATMEEVEQAAKLAQADHFIKQHPKGYDFKVGEEGNYLSGGQRQRLMLARAFLKNAKILILDEPFSSLDEQTKTEIWKSIQKVAKDKTVIIVSNILDVITKADCLIILNRSKITYNGKYTLKKEDTLAKLMLENT